MPYLTREASQDESIPCRTMTAALELFVKEGYHKVSIHDIQKQADVSIGSIYNHFGGKEGVAQGLYDHLLKEMDLVIDEVQSTSQSAEARCQTLIHRLLTYTETHRSIVAFIFGTRHREFLSGQTPLCSSRPFVRVREMVEQAIQQGHLRPMTPWVAASVVFGSTIRLIQLRLDGMIEQPLPELADEVISMVWQGVAATAYLSQAGLPRASRG